MIGYLDGRSIIKSLIEKCGQGIGFPLNCILVGQFEKGKNEKWSYDIRTPRVKIGEIDYFPLNNKVEVRALPNEPFTLGENYRKQFENDLQTLVDMEFVGTRIKTE